MIFDMHIHTRQSSPCGQEWAKDIVDAYKSIGFDGIVITDHVTRVTYKKMGLPTWKEFCLNHKRGYEEAKSRAEEVGLRVLYGCELRFDETLTNDYLVYGMPNEYLIDNPDILGWTVAQFKEEAEKEGFLFYQAHPFRNSMVIVPPCNLYGMEVYNGKNATDYNDFIRNDMANMWAQKNKLRRIAGSDFHEMAQLGKAGVNFIDDVTDNASLLKALRENRYMLVTSSVNCN